MFRSSAAIKNSTYKHHQLIKQQVQSTGIFVASVSSKINKGAAHRDIVMALVIIGSWQVEAKVEIGALIHIMQIANLH